MKPVRLTAVFSLLLSGESTAIGATPTSVVASPIRPCALYGFSADRDPSGLRVRAAPLTRARVVGLLPGVVEPRDDANFAPAFRITGSSNGWLRIAEANDNYNPGRPRPTYRGVGWVHGSMVRVAVQGTIGRIAPAPTARVVVNTGEDWLVERAGFTPVLGCSGKWAKVRYAIRRSPGRSGIRYAPPQGQRAGEAWFTGICGEQHTTCDSVREGN